MDQLPKTKNDLNQIVQAYLAEAKQWANTVPIIALLRSVTQINGLIRPEDEQTATLFWGGVAGQLMKNGLRHQGVDVAVAWYDQLNGLQASESTRYHKGGAAWMLALCYREIGEVQRAYWFNTMAFVEDVVSSGVAAIPASGATQGLRIFFHQSEASLKAMAEGAIAVKNQHPKLARHPEAVAVYLARREELAIPFTQAVEDTPLNRQFLQQLINDLNAAHTKEKGEALEFLASYLAITLPGARIKANLKSFEQRDAKFEFEVDVLVTQHATLSSYLLEALGRHFLIECKNWSDAVGVSELNHFVAKMRFHRCRCGIIFSQKGLTGEKGPDLWPRHARLTQLRWYHQDDCVVIVVDENQLREMADNNVSFTELLLRGYESVRFSIPEK